MRAGEQLAEVGPIFIRSQTACSCASLTGLSSQPLWVRARKQRLAGRVVYRVVHRSPATGSIADSPSRKMVLKVSASVTLQAWPPHGISTSWLPGIAVCSTREQEAGTSRSSAALIISVGQAMADARRENQPASGLQPLQQILFALKMADGKRIFRFEARQARGHPFRRVEK